MIKLALLNLLLLTGIGFLSGCIGAPAHSSFQSHAVTTPSTYTEARVFYLDVAKPGSGYANLKHSYELVSGEVGKGNSPRNLSDNFVQHNQPISVIVNKVVLPPFAGKKHIAVLLDIHTSEDIGNVPLVVWYQRNAMGGDTLNFENLIVYYDQAWNSQNSPTFRVRILDVSVEKNRATLELLDKVGKLASSISGFIPHPAVPGIDLAIELGKQLMANSANKALISYTVQFYAADRIANDGGANLGYLRKGHWIVLGKDHKTEPEFWREDFVYDLETLRLYHSTNKERQSTARVDIPSMLLTVSTAESVVPSIVLDRSVELTKLLAADQRSQDIDAITRKVETLQNALSVYLLARRVQVEQSGEAMRAMMETLELHYLASQPGAPVGSEQDILSSGDVHLLSLTLQRATGEKFSDLSDALSWWEKSGSQYVFRLDKRSGEVLWLPR